jgi:hypothetical protein
MDSFGIATCPELSLLWSHFDHLVEMGGGGEIGKMDLDT